MEPVKRYFPESTGNDEKLSLRTLAITPIQDLNQGVSPINSHATSTARSSLKMNFRTYVSIGQTSLGVTAPNYPRVKKLANGSYMMLYHNNQIGGSVRYATSPDAKTWTYQNELFKSYAITDQDGLANERRFSNGDALVLANGDILAVASYRANSGYRQKPLDAGLAIRRSTDNGVTWSTAAQIYQGVNWEPYLLQLPSGEIQCYFTDAARTAVIGTDTGTDMVVSNDNGVTWTPSFGAAPYYVLRTQYTYNGNTFSITRCLR
ncbi:glycoside hydrolase [Chitinophaga sedimenti]|uniref:sialidase family protein n=1 Tax=Chitinophaga sedimenti TaxID=2033606 RepID=UPI002006A897|nr:sialidase family protein [Chitinophaga sedimenti]MCK7554628.1 glycoside hydrolase [Chitinophaga sedimenti]